VTYWLVRWPAWARGVLMGAAWAVLCFIFLGSDRVLLSAVLWAAGGVVFAFVMTRVAARQEHRMYEVDGHLLGIDERVRMLRAVDAGRWPAGAGPQHAAERLVRWRLQRGQSPTFQIIAYGVLLLISINLAIVRSPWWWIFTGGWVIVSVWQISISISKRRAAEEMLSTPPSSRSPE
jgi:hypothetical protein